MEPKGPTVYPADDLLKMSDAFRAPERPGEAKWFLATHEDRLYLHPYPFPEVLFRGQNRRYTPCVPSMFRGLGTLSSTMSEMPVRDQGLMVLRLAKSWWFASELEEHPAMKWANEERIYVDKIALAQHYELETGYLDVSHDFNVAAFFATCCRRDAGWQPQTDGIGIIYRVDLAKVPQDPLQFAQAVGLQPLPRPEQQRAWVIEVPLAWDFESHPAVSWIQFRQSEAVSRHFLELFDGGAKLFPPDPLAVVAEQIGKAGEIAADLVDRAIDSFCQDRNGIRSQDRSTVRHAVSGMTTLGNYVHLMRHQDTAAMERAWNAQKDNFGKFVTTRPVRS